MALCAILCKELSQGMSEADVEILGNQMKAKVTEKVKKRAENHGGPQL